MAVLSGLMPFKAGRFLPLLKKSGTGNSGEKSRRESTGTTTSRPPVDRRLDLLRSREAHSEPASAVDNRSDSEDDDEEEKSDAELSQPAPFRSRLQSRQSDPLPPSRQRSPLTERTTSAFSLPVQSSNEYSDRFLVTYQQVLKDLANNEETHKQVAVGKRIGFYRLGKELGAGNFSKVKIGVHLLTQERVAVKIMEKAKMDQKAQRLLAREIECMEKVRHPNIVRLFEVVETISRVHLICEYARGGELYVYVHEKGKLTEKEAKPLFAQIASAVEHLHDHNIAHRDIKAENILFSEPGGKLKLCDFGFSRSLEDGTLQTFCGSPPYAAPELYKDESYDGKCVDVWALGILLYFILVGVTPFRAETVHDLKNRVLEGRYNIPDYLSLFVQELIRRMLEMQPTVRLNISEVKKMYWLKEMKFPKEYEDDERSEDIMDRLKKIGIDEEMLDESRGRGSRCAINGAYRLVCNQVRKEQKELNAKLKEMRIAAENQRLGVANKRGGVQKSDKVCTIS